jgi:hypothetical protein
MGTICCDVLEGSFQDRFRSRGSTLNKSDGLFWTTAAANEPARDCDAIVDAHQDDKRVDQSVLSPIYVLPRVSRDDGKAAGHVPMRQRNTGESGHGQGGTDARHKFGFNPVFERPHPFFRAASKDEWISAFQANHRFPFTGVSNDQLENCLLRLLLFAFMLAYIDKHRAAASVTEHLGANQTIVQNDIAGFQHANCFDRK